MKKLAIVLLSISLLVPLQTRAAEPEIPAPATDSQTKKIKELIVQLGDNDWSRRVSATEELKKIGKPALPALEEAANSQDEEVRTRAKTIVKFINAPPPPKAAPAAGGLGALGGAGGGDMNKMLGQMLGGMGGGQGGQGGGDMGAMLGQMLGGMGGGQGGGQGMGDMSGLIGQLLGGMGGGQGGQGGGDMGALLGQMLGGMGGQGGQGGNGDMGALLGQMLGGMGGAQGGQGGQGGNANAMLGQLLGGAGGAKAVAPAAPAPKFSLPIPTTIMRDDKEYRISHKIIVEITESKDGKKERRIIEADDEADLEKKDVEAFKIYQKTIRSSAAAPAAPANRAPQAGAQLQALQNLGALQNAMQHRPQAVAAKPPPPAPVTPPPPPPPPVLDLLDGFGARFEAGSDGISIVGIKNGSPAEKAGLKLGDIIKKADGAVVAKLEDIQNVLEKKSSKSVNPHQFEISRDGKTQTLKFKSVAAK